LLAAKGYDSNANRDDLHERIIEPSIPFRRNRKERPSIDGYALRNPSERCFNKLEQSRRLATRQDRLQLPLLRPPRLNTPLVQVPCPHGMRHRSYTKSIDSPVTTTRGRP
jgi:transposase